MSRVGNLLGNYEMTDTIMIMINTTKVVAVKNGVAPQGCVIGMRFGNLEGT